MRLVNCEYTLDKSKVIFNFTADDRIDFRKLVKVHNERPHGPIPPSSFASSRTPICLSSIRVLKF
jgi:hypothetical protein